MAPEPLPVVAAIFRVASIYQRGAVAMEGIMMTLKLGDIFTEDEVKHMAALVAQGASARRIAEEVIEPVLERIDKETGQENDALYLAYAALYAIHSKLDIVDGQ